MSNAATEVVLSAAALLKEIDAARGLKIGRTGILDPLHPICVSAEHMRTALKCYENRYQRRLASWTPPMVKALFEYRQQGLKLEICAEKIGVCYPECVLKARELGLSKRMNHGRRPGVEMIREASK